MTMKKKSKLPRGIALLSVGIILGLSSCGGDDSSPAASGSGGSGNTSSGGSSNNSGGSGGNSGGCVFDSECPSGQECSNEGLCVTIQDPGSQCSGVFQHCPGASAANECVNLATDDAHCGACDGACATDENCISGVCTKDCGNLQLCGTACADLKTEPLHCGTCDNACNSGQVCTDGTCGCETGKCGDNCTLTLCQGACADTQTDTNNCGNCGNTCKLSTTGCVGGVCQYPAEVCNDIDDDADGTCNEGCETQIVNYQEDINNPLIGSSSLVDVHYTLGNGYSASKWTFRGEAFKTYKQQGPGMVPMFQCRVNAKHYLQTTPCPADSVDGNGGYWNERLGYFWVGQVAPCAAYSRLLGARKGAVRFYTSDPNLMANYESKWGLTKDTSVETWYVPR